MASILHLSSFRSSKCKKHLQLTMQRIKILRNKNIIMVKQERTDIAKLLKNRHTTGLKMRVEHAIKEHNMVEAYNILEQCCSSIIDGMRIIDSKKECPPTLKASMATLMYATPRCGELQELQSVREFFTSKYGAEFVADATQLRAGCAVNDQIVRCLSSRSPTSQTKLEFLKDIAREYKITWDCEEFLMESLQKRTDSEAEPKHPRNPSNAAQSLSLSDFDQSRENSASSKAFPLTAQESCPAMAEEETLVPSGTKHGLQVDLVESGTQAPISGKYDSSATRDVGKFDTQAPTFNKIQHGNSCSDEADKLLDGKGRVIPIERVQSIGEADKISAGFRLDGRATDVNVGYRQHNKGWMFSDERISGVHVRSRQDDLLLQNKDQCEEDCDIHSESDETVESVDSLCDTNFPKQFIGLVLNGSDNLLNRGLSSRGDGFERLKHRMEQQSCKEDLEAVEEDDAAEPADVSDQLLEAPFRMEHLRGFGRKMEAGCHGAHLDAGGLSLSLQHSENNQIEAVPIEVGSGKLKWKSATDRNDAELSKNDITRKHVSNPVEQVAIRRQSMQVPDAGAIPSVKGKSFYGESHRTRPIRQ